MGVADDFKSAALAKMRHGWSLVQQQTLFDQLDSSQNLLGELMIKIIQKNYTPGKVKRILGEEPTQEFYSKKFAKYNVAVEEGFDTMTQKQHEFTQLVVLKEMGVEIPDSALINSASIQNKDDLIAAIDQQKQEVQQTQEQQAQLDSAEAQATMNMMNAKAESDKAMAKRRESEIDKDKFDMINETMETARDEQKADLEAIKVLKDLEQTDPNKIDELIELMRIIQDEREDTSQPEPFETDERSVFEDELLNQQMASEPIAQNEGPQEQAFQEEMLQPDEQNLM